MARGTDDTIVSICCRVALPFPSNLYSRRLVEGEVLSCQSFVKARDLSVSGFRSFNYFFQLLV